MVVKAFDTRRHSGEKLIRDGFGGLGITLEEVVGAKDYGAVAFSTGNIGNIDKRHIHADRTYDGSLTAIDDYTTVTVAKLAMKPVGVTERKDGDTRGARSRPTAVVTYGVASGDLLYLRDMCHQAADLL